MNGNNHKKKKEEEFNFDIFLHKITYSMSVFCISLKSTIVNLLSTHLKY